MMKKMSFIDNTLLLFTDGSVNTKNKVGYGAYLAVTEPANPELLKQHVKVKRFDNTTSTKLELQTLLWALNDVEVSDRKVIVYTDSQNIIGLPDRRERLEKSGYYSKKNNRLKNYELYQEFYRVIDKLDCEFVKVRGHNKTKDKDDIERVFTLVDRASRRAIRSEK